MQAAHGSSALDITLLTSYLAHLGSDGKLQDMMAEYTKMKRNAVRPYTTTAVYRAVATDVGDRCTVGTIVRVVVGCWAGGCVCGEVGTVGVVVSYGVGGYHAAFGTVCKWEWRW